MIGGTSILIVRSTRVTEEIISAAGELKLIIRAGASVNTIDVNAATRKGVYVANCPGKNAAAVAELVMGLLIALDRNIVDTTNDLRNGQWTKGVYPYGMGLAGNSLGILGFGAAGQAVAAAARGFGMEVMAWSRSLSRKKATDLNLRFCATPLELAQQADVISVHLAANSSTFHLVDRRFLQAMRDGAYLINTSRGQVVDTIALKEMMYRKGLRVGLDVFENEPKGHPSPFQDTQLARMIVATPHIGASTKQALEETSREVVRIAASFINNAAPLNAVNSPASSPFPPSERGLDYVDRGFKMAAALDRDA